ncbi:MAG TPA: hypothetical protein VGC41_02535 [Kofleriaceae bacterium]
MSDRTVLRDRLCTELAHAEHDARIHTCRQAARLGDTPPGHALHAICEHTAEVEPMIEKLMKTTRPSHGALRWIGDLISSFRFALADRFASPDRAYRAVLAELKRGVDAARLLREVVSITEDEALLKFCDLILVERLCLIEEADDALVWFAEHPERHLLPAKTGDTVTA